MTVVWIWVGGVPFCTSRETLNMRPSFFSGLVQSSNDTHEFVVDRDPSHFRYVLNYMRGKVALPSDYQTLRELRNEAEFYCLVDLMCMIDDELHRHPGSVDMQLAAIATAISSLRR